MRRASIDTDATLNALALIDDLLASFAGEDGLRRAASYTCFAGLIASLGIDVVGDELLTYQRRAALLNYVGFVLLTEVSGGS